MAEEPLNHHISPNMAHHYYINNVFSAFIRGIADYFKTEWFDGRNKDIVISTYEKAVEHFRNRQNFGGEKFSPKYPFITFNPEIDFEPDDPMGKFFHNYPIYKGYSSQIAANLYSPYIFEDDNVTISAVMNRYKGNFEMILWASSVYELIDFKAYTYQFFGGMNRPIYPAIIESYLTLPDEFIYYTYDNPYTAEKYNLDWEKSTGEINLFKNINQNKMVFPFVLRPWIKLTGASDGSEKYGGSGDEIGDHRLVINMEWEVTLPTHMIMRARKFPDRCHKFQMDIQVSSRYIPLANDSSTQYPVADEVTVVYDDMIDSTASAEEAMVSVDLIYHDAYQYVWTQEDYDLANSTTVADKDKKISLDIPREPTDCVYLKVYGKYGELVRDFYWNVVSQNQLELVAFNLNSLEVDDILMIVYYTEND